MERAPAHSVGGGEWSAAAGSFSRGNVDADEQPASRQLPAVAAPLLGGVPQKIESGRRASAQVQQAIERHRPQPEAYETLCAEIGEQPADVAPAWLLHNPVLTATIVGPRTPEQLAASRRALDVVLSDDTLRKLDEIWPGPGGEAPEAYAWEQPPHAVGPVTVSEGGGADRMVPAGASRGGVPRSGEGGARLFAQRVQETILEVLVVHCCAGAGASWVAAQEASRRRPSSDAEPGSAA